MPKFSVKSLYAILGAGAVCSVSTGLYYGLGSSLTINSSSAEHSGGADTSGTQISVPVGSSGKSCTMEVVSGYSLTEQEQQQLGEELSQEGCSQ